jgi:MFS family permease
VTDMPPPAVDDEAGDITDVDTTEPADAAPPRGLGPNYHRLFTASMMTNLGDGLMSVAVVWVATTLTRSPLLIAMIGLATRLPWLLVSLPAGVIADRADRRVLVASMDIVRLVLIAAFGLVVLAVQSGLPHPEDLASGVAAAPASAPLLLGLLYLVALLVGCAEVVRDNSAQTLMPAVVSREHLERANGRLWGAESALNNFIGPPLAGVMVAVALAWPFLLNAVLLGVSAVLILQLDGSFRPKGQTSNGRIDWRGEIAEGFGWLWRNRLLRALAILLGAMNMLSQVAFVIFVLYAQEILGLFEGWQFGFLLTGMAVGAVTGSFLADRVARRLTSGTALLVAMTGMGLAFVVLAVTSSAIVVWSTSVVNGFLIMLWNVITVSLRQRIIPDNLLGRVNSVYRFFGWGTMSIGTLLGGVFVTVAEPAIGRELALRAPFLLAGIASLLLLVYAVPRINTAVVRAAEAEAVAADAEAHVDG